MSNEVVSATERPVARASRIGIDETSTREPETRIPGMLRIGGAEKEIRDGDTTESASGVGMRLSKVTVE